MTTLMSVEQFREELQRSECRRVACSVSASSRRYRWTAPSGRCDSATPTSQVDRMGDTIRAAGWDISDYVRNPVALWAHDSSSPPIGGGRNVGVEATRLMGDIEFAPPETYQFADTIYRLVLGKFLRAVSVGFLPTRHLFVQDDPDRPWGIDFLEQQLLEISVCPVPANPNALAEARRKGIDTRPLVEWAERVLDGGGGDMKRVLITPDELQRLRTAAKEPSMAVKPRASGQTRRAPVRRDEGGATEDDPTSGGAIVGNCGRAPDDQCGLTDPSECSIHGGARADPDDEEKLLRAISPTGRATEGWRLRARRPACRARGLDPARAKSLRTAKAYMAEGMTHHAKALSLLDGVVDALDTADPITDPPPDSDPEPAARRRRTWRGPPNCGRKASQPDTALSR